MKKKIIIDCKNLNEEGMNNIETVVRNALKVADLDCYVKVSRG